MLGEESPFDYTQNPKTPWLRIRRHEDCVVEEETRRRLGIALYVLGFIILAANGLIVIGHYLVGWPIPSLPGVAVGVVFLVVGLVIASKKRQI